MTLERGGKLPPNGPLGARRSLQVFVAPVKKMVTKRSSDHRVFVREDVTRKTPSFLGDFRCRYCRCLDCRGCRRGRRGCRRSGGSDWRCRRSGTRAASCVARAGGSASHATGSGTGTGGSVAAASARAAASAGACAGSRSAAASTGASTASATCWGWSWNWQLKWFDIGQRARPAADAALVNANGVRSIANGTKALAGCF